MNLLLEPDVTLGLGLRPYLRLYRCLQVGLSVTVACVVPLQRKQSPSNIHPHDITWQGQSTQALTPPPSSLLHSLLPVQPPLFGEGGPVNGRPSFSAADVGGASPLHSAVGCHCLAGPPHRWRPILDLLTHGDSRSPRFPPQVNGRHVFG